MADSPLRILLVEDDADDVFLLGQMLKEAANREYALAVAGRLGEAVRRLEEESFDVVLLDLSLPDSQGLETFETMHEHAPEIPVVVLTGRDDEALARQAMHGGAQDYLVKARVDGPLLVRSMRYAIERQQTIRYRALLMERSRFDAAVSQMSDGILVVDGKGRLTHTNRAARLLLNLPEEGWKGLGLGEALAAFTLSTPVAELLGGRERSAVVEIARAETHPPLYLSAALSRLVDQAGELLGAVLVLREVTAEREARHVQANFFLLVSHKLRTPLAVILGCLELLGELAPAEREERLDQFLAMMGEQARRLDTTLRRLLDFKEMAAPDYEAERRPTELGAAVGRVEETLRRHYPGRALEISFSAAPGAEATEAAEEDVGAVLEALLDNAVKFTPADPVRVEVTSTAPQPGWIEVAVRDQGPGIPHEYFDRIFQGFMQIEEHPTGEVPGLGVGLYMARRIVETYGGSLQVSSALGQGSELRAVLPAAPAAGQP